MECLRLAMTLTRSAHESSLKLMASVNPIKIALEALKRSKAERTVYLDQVCGDDQALRKAAEALFGEDGDDDEFLEPPIEGVACQLAAEWLRGRSDSGD